MFLPILNRHLAICGILELDRMLESEPVGFWHVVTVLDTGVAMPRLSRGATSLRLFAADERNRIRQPGVGDPDMEMVRKFLHFADSTSPAPLLLHCVMGVSRSTALALVLLLRAHGLAGDGPEKAVEALVDIRPQANPNPNIVSLGVNLIEGGTQEDAEEIARRILSHPAFRHN